MSIDFSGENGPTVNDDSNAFAPRPVWDSGSKRRRGRASTSRTTGAARMSAAAAPVDAEATAADTPAGSETAFGDPAVRTTTTSTRARSGVPAGALIAGAAVLVVAGGVAWYATQHQTSTGVAQLTPGVPGGGATSTTTTQSTQTAQNAATPTMPTTLSSGTSHSLHIATNTGANAAPVHTHAAAVSATRSSRTHMSPSRSASTDAGMNASATVATPPQAYTPPPPASAAPVNPSVAPVMPTPAPQPSTTVQPATPSMSTAPATTTGPDTAAQPAPSTGATGADTSGSTGGATMGTTP